jgi:vitamin B12 transporter
VGYTNAWTSNLGPDVAPSVNDGQRIKFDWRGVALITQGETLVMGLEDELFSLEETAIPSAFNADKAAYLELQSQFTQHLFMVSNIRFDDNDAFGDHDTFRIAPAYIVPWTNTKLKASYGTGFKAPTLSELYVNFPAFGFFANPNLQPETSRGYDYGFEQPIANGRFNFGATYFHNDLTDLIDTNATFTSYANIGRATTYGVESFASLVVSPSLTLREDYTYTIAKDDTTGEELLRRPINKASFTATWKPTNKFNASLIMIDVGSWRDVNRSGTETGFLAPGYQVVNLAANYAISGHYTLFGRIDNLFNHQYEDPTGFDRPGFGIFGGVRVTMN